MPLPTPFDHDAALLACARGEQPALRRLYEHESRWLLGVALRIVRDRQAAEDVLHDAFLRIWQGSGSFDPKLGSGRGWVYTVVRHSALNEVRRRRRDMAVDVDPDVSVSEPSALQAAQSDASGLDTIALERCLAALDEPRRRSIVHAFVDGYNHEQIAKRMQAPLGTVKSWIRRGLLSLKECLS